jgi:hypothetical protein
MSTLPYYKLRQVFTPGGFPSVTYVSREHLNLEKRLQGALARGHGIITVTGPTKSGKTVLCRKVLGGEETLWIEGGRIREEKDFWDQVVGSSKAPTSISHSSAINSTADGKLGLTGELAVPGLGKIAGNAVAGRAAGRTETVQHTFSSDQKANTLKALIDGSLSLVIDDFHFVSKDVQAIIVNSLKSAVFDGLNVIIIAVPHRAFDPLAVQQEMQGRFIHLEIEAWTLEELKLIPERGFPALNVIVRKSLIKKICDESFLNPLLVQDICSRTCAVNDILHTQEEERELINVNMDIILEDVAKNSGFPTYDRLKRGPQTRTDRKPRNLKQGGTVDIYQAIMLAVAYAGPKVRTEYDELRSSLRDLLADGALPQKNEITSSCGHMSQIAKNELSHAEPIEWYDDGLVISDPFLLFFLRWQRESLAKGASVSKVV